MRISDWSSDVCSSDLTVYYYVPIADCRGSVKERIMIITAGSPAGAKLGEGAPVFGRPDLDNLYITSATVGLTPELRPATACGALLCLTGVTGRSPEIGRASCRDRVCQYV